MTTEKYEGSFSTIMRFVSDYWYSTVEEGDYLNNIDFRLEKNTMENIKISKLKKRLCIKSGCTGYLYSSINKYKENVLRCKDCHNWIKMVDYDFLVLQDIKEYKYNDEIDNQRFLNNYKREVSQ